MQTAIIVCLRFKKKLHGQLQFEVLKPENTIKSFKYGLRCHEKQDP